MTMHTTRIRGGPGNYEWATICWQGWQSTGNDGQPRECGEILIHSSFGSWGNSWGHLGIEFDKFLQKAERSYMAEKLMGSKAYKFDGDLTVQRLRERVIEWRRDGSFTKDQARAVWDWIEENESELTIHGGQFVNTMYEGSDSIGLDSRAGQFFEEPWEQIRTGIHRSFAGFWRDLWPVFVQQLKEAS